MCAIIFVPLFYIVNVGGLYMKEEKLIVSPLVLSHQPIKFETAQSWNPGCGKIPDNNGKEPAGGHPVGPVNPGKGHNTGNHKGHYTGNDRCK